MAFYDINGKLIATGGSGGASPIEGKRIAMIGDSNTQYSGADIKSYMESTYGCAFVPLGYAGATWETTAGTGATDNSAVGRVNTIIANADSSKLITEYDTIVIMMGTNCSAEGELTDTSADVTTMCGAMRYCMEKLCYYGRKISIGVIIPIRSDGTKGGEMPSKFEKIAEIARQFNVPTLDLWNEGRIIDNSMTPDGTSYYLGDSVHLGANGTANLCRIMGKWIAYKL
ncbi:MAG: SGNH/GDSL hydrolase family protein [Oscillospiraceae bacterium]|nr:SGNH/GDSL hydrolase family protein [Oscillospiraceae bacterium]